MSKNQYAIETISLTKVFPDWWGRAKVIAVEDLNLKINHNEVYGLLGPNGSGKTTTLKMLLGLLHPSKGKAIMLGGDINSPDVKDRIGYLPEESYLYKFLNAKETLDFYGRIFGLSKDVRRARIDALLEMVGLAGMENRPIGTYSKGMARRIGLAQALINDPELLILDEPTSGMDPIGTRQMKDLIKLLAERGKTILLCSHLLADVEDVCDRISILYGGKMQTEGQVRSLLQHTEQRQILTGSIPDSAIEKIKQIVAEHSSECEVTHPVDKLEDFFVRTVSRAREQKSPTSGAVDTQRLDKFLAAVSPQSKVLEKLVQTDISAQPQAPEKSETEKAQVEKPAPVETPEKPDENLLRNLTKTESPDEGQTVDDNQPQSQQKPEPEPAEQEKEPDKKILEELTGRKNSSDGTTETTHEDQNESGDNNNA